MTENNAAATVTHLLFCQGADADQVRVRVSHFFEKNFLVKYDRVVIPPERIISAEHPEFWPRLEAGLAENRRALAGFLTELQESGFQQLAELAGMQQGYESKVLHTVTHLLDGFFGIDSHFYNLEEEAHVLSDRVTRAVREDPRRFWLVEAGGTIESGHEANRLEAIRGFKVSPPGA